MPLWLRSLLGRPAGAGLLGLAVLTVAAAATGPMVARGVEQAALRNALISAPVSARSVVATDHTGSTRTLTAAVADVDEVTGVAAQSRLFEPGTVTAETGDPVAVRPAAAGAGFSARLVAGSPGCRGFVVTAGRCARDSRELLVAAGSDAPRVGAVLLLGPGRAHFVVAGAYSRSTVTLPSSAFAVGARVGPDLVVTLGGLNRLPEPVTVVGRSKLIVSRVGIDQLPAVRAVVAKAQQATLTQAQSLAFDSGLPGLLRRVDAQRVAAAGLVFVVTAQVVALALFAAVSVMATLARARSPEWALSRLRAVRRPAWLSALYAEPAAVLIIGAVAGFAVGGLTARLAAGAWLGGTRTEPWRATVLATVALVVAGLAVGLVSASVRSARAPLASLLREGAEPARGSRLALVGETLVLVLAAAAVYQVAVSTSLSGRGAGLALLAPGLLSVAVGLLAIRAAGGLAQRSTRRAPRGICGLLVWRRMARVPSRLRRDVVVAIAAAVAVFAVQLVALAGRNQLLRAQAQVGAATVLQVRVPTGKSLLQIVRAADPAGTQAMAVAERNGPSDTGTSRVVAVDSPRLARISPWRAGWAGMDAQQLARALHPRAPIKPVLLTGDRLEIALGQVNVTPDSTDSGVEPGAPPPAVAMSWTVADATGWHQIAFPPLTGQHRAMRFTARLACPHSCRLVQIGLAPAESGTPYEASFVLTRLQTSTQPAASFAGLLGNSAAWQQLPGTDADRAGVVAVPLADGLKVTIVDSHESGGAFAPTDVPVPLPVVLGRGVDVEASPLAGAPDAVAGVGLDDQQQPLSVVATAAVVPRALADGVLVDLANISAVSNPADSLARQEVWLTPGPHAAVRRALTAAGITITGTQTITAAHAVIARSGPARAVLINIALIVLAALLALAALVAAQLIGAAKLRQLWAAAAVAGLPRRATRRAVFLELAVPACAGALLGTAAGLAAVMLAGHRLPLFAAHTAGPPLDTVPDWLLFAATAGIAVAALVLVAAISATLQSRFAGRPPR